MKKSHAQEIRRLKIPVRHRTLAPFGGITRIRFKGSSSWTSQPLRLPRSIELRIRPDPAKSTEHMVRASARTRRIRDVMPAAKLPNENLSAGWSLFDVRVENREPVGAFLFPDASGIIGARHGKRETQTGSTRYTQKK